MGHMLTKYELINIAVANLLTSVLPVSHGLVTNPNCKLLIYIHPQHRHKSVSSTFKLPLAHWNFFQRFYQFFLPFICLCSKTRKLAPAVFVMKRPSHVVVAHGGDMTNCSHLLLKWHRFKRINSIFFGVVHRWWWVEVKFLFSVTILKSVCFVWRVRIKCVY